MDREVTEALARFKETGPGEEVNPEDLANVQSFVFRVLFSTEGISLDETRGLVDVLRWGHWADGWNLGYTAGTKKATPHFSLITPETGKADHDIEALRLRSHP